MTVSSEQRAALARAVSGLRRTFEADYAALAEGKFGIHVVGRRAGEIEDVTSLSLSAHDLATRNELVGVVDYLRGEGFGDRESVQRMLREAVFTTVNRLLAVRVAEAIGVVPPSLAEGTQSEGFVEAVEAFPLLRDADDSGGYWTYLQICGDELSHAVPRLFDRRHPLSALVPSAEALDESVRLLTDAALADVWIEPEALGWSYQFFNSQDERRAMRDASSTPRDSRELAVRNQFFTPDYVVDFLVQNTLGRRLRESGYDLELPLLLGNVNPRAQPIDLDDVAVLDPAVGSGHFLLGAYDLLERAWEAQGVGPDEAAPRIVGSLHGIEIDPRAAQVAQAVIYLRARRSSRNAHLEAAAIVTARPLPRDPDIRGDVLAAQPGIVRDLVDGLSAALDSAPDLGSLLKAEDLVVGALGERVQRPQLGDDLAESNETIEAAVSHAAAEIARRADATPAERLFAAEATDALRFVDTCARRYDVVLMNPPFGGGVPSTSRYLRASYSMHSDLYAAFVERGKALLNQQGYLGALTSRSGFFLSSFADWRSSVVVPTLRAMVDLGHGVLHEAMVEVAAYVLSAGPTSGGFVVRRALRVADKALGITNGDDYVVDGAELLAVPGAPISYWVGHRFRELYSTLPALEGNVATVRGGAYSGDDFRRVRAWWEVRGGASSSDARWVPFSKGGEYSPYQADVHLCVAWDHDRRTFWEYYGRPSRPSVLPDNVDHYFKPGVSWPNRTNASLSVRPLPGGSVFSHKSGVALDGDSGFILGLMNSRVFRHLADMQLSGGEATSGGSPSRSYEVGVMQRIPAPPISSTSQERVREAALELARFGGRRASREETSLTFDGMDVDPPDWTAEAARLMDVTGVIDAEVNSAYGLSKEDTAELDSEQGPNPAGYPRDTDIPAAEFAELWHMTDDKLAAEAVRRLEGRRYLAVKAYFLDRHLELLCHIFEAHPEKIVAMRDALDLNSPKTAQSFGEEWVSYLVGTAFGRWDVRLAIDPPLEPSSEPFNELPAYPPGMLVDDDGLPAKSPIPDYPLGLPPHRLLHDDPGHPWDLATALEAVAKLLPGDLLSQLPYLGDEGSPRDLRLYFRDRFFKLHLSRYSKSRRKAPIYWHLAVPSMEWGLWLYAPWLSREQLFAVAQAAQEKIRQTSQHLLQLEGEPEVEEPREARQQREAIEDLLEELRAFHRRAEAVAQSGWKPDLNDGIILNAAPLEDLFADAKWRKDISTHRKKMEQGDYPWATVQRDYFDRFRS